VYLQEGGVTKDVEEVMVMFESSVECFRGDGTSALGAMTVPNPVASIHTEFRPIFFRGNHHAFHLAPSGFVTSQTRNVSVNLVVICTQTPNLRSKQRTAQALLNLKPKDLTKNLPGHGVPMNASLLRQM